MQYRPHPRTATQEARRQLRIVKRREARGPIALVAVKRERRPRTSFRAYLRELRAGRDAALDFAGRIARALADRATRRTPRCPHQRHEHQEDGALVTYEPCGGRLGRTTLHTLRCRTCGRDWRTIGSKSDRLELVVV